MLFNTRPKREEHLLNGMDIFTNDEHLSQPLQTNDKQFRFTVSFLAASNETFNVTSKKNSIPQNQFKMIILMLLQNHQDLKNSEG